MSASMRRLRRRQGGWVMLATLGLLLVISLVVAGLYLQSEEHLVTTRSIAGQQVALQRAEEGLQVAVQSIRAGVIPISTVTQFCNQADVKLCSPGMLQAADRYSIAPVSRGNTLDLREGGGLQYEYHIVRRALDGQPTNRYLVQAVGFYGYPNGRSMVTSVVEADVDVGSNVAGQTNNDGNGYD